MDPLYKSVYNDLAYTYYDLEDFDKSIWAINKYIELAPDEPNPYDSRGDLYAWSGKLDQAIESYKKALAIKPDFYMSLPKLGHMYLFKRDYAKAESCYKELASSSDKDTRSQGRTYLAYIPMYQGKFEQALEALGDGIAADKMEQIKWEPSTKYFLRAMIYEDKKNLNLALNEIKKGMEICRKQSDPDAIFYWQDHYAYLLVENGDVTEGEEVSNTLRRDIEKKDPANLFAYTDYWYMVGKIELAKGNLETAITNFVKATQSAPYFDACFLLSGIYLKLGRLGEAVAELEKGLLRYDGNRALNTIDAVKAYYLLGLAYEESGWNKKAIEKYEEFLNIWKDADPGIKEVEDAKERLKKLRVES
jgi:tetratricopeptide (TPR) repeat protein